MFLYRTGLTRSIRSGDDYGQTPISESWNYVDIRCCSRDTGSVEDYGRAWRGPHRAWFQTLLRGSTASLGSVWNQALGVSYAEL